MVLCRNDFFQKVIERFRAEPDIDNLEIGMHDFFTNRIVYGLHVYSNRINIDHSDENVFIDRIIIRKKHVTYINELAPAALHCPNPSTFQCFHYGLHKAIKITQYGRDNLRHFACIVHWDNILKLVKNFQNKNDIALALAIIGAYEGIKKKYTQEVINFNNEIAISNFHIWDSIQNNAIISKAKQISTFVTLMPNNLLLEIILFRRNWYKGLKHAVIQLTKYILENKLAKYQKKA